MPDLKFSVFTDEKCCLVSKHIPLKEELSYTWVEQSEVSDKWLVFARPPGATRCDSLTVWNKKEDAENVATEILDSIRKFPLDEWNKKHSSKYYRNFLDNLPDDDDGNIANI